MAETAENLASRYRISRDAQDEFAALSHARATLARDRGRFAEEIVPVDIPGVRRSPGTLRDDEHIRSETTVERLRALPARFRESGTVTAGNSSGINDGAAAVVLAEPRVAAGMGIRPLGRLLAWAAVGVPPEIMGIGPAPAMREALARAELELDQIGVIEINEAFAAQYLAVENELALKRDRVNPNGGAIALGHPIGASGSRLLLTVLYELRRSGERYGAAALCIGGGQGIAAVVEAG
jgi:acetyl-CoA C-acetyltransferase